MDTITEESKVALKEAMSAPFSTPQRRRGQMVTYFINGKRDGRTLFGFVRKCGERFTDIQLTDGSTCSAVAHIDDPKLKNPNIRDKGAWDYTEEEVFRRKRDHALYRRLRQVEFAVLHSPMATREMLCDHAKMLGLSGYTKAKNSEVKEMIRKRYAELFDDVDPALVEERLIEDEDDSTDIESIQPPPEDSALLENSSGAEEAPEVTDG